MIYDVIGKLAEIGVEVGPVDDVRPLLGRFGSGPSPDGILRLEVKPKYFVARPGFVQLEPYEPGFEAPPRHLMLNAYGPPFSFEDEISPYSPPTITTVLEAKKYAMDVHAEVRERIPVVYDRSGKWKRFPPSKRRKLKSWRRARLEERLKFAPLNGDRTKVRYSDHHPDAGRTRHRGSVALRWLAYVYAQPSAEDLVKEKMDRLGQEWAYKVQRALGGLS